jgi:2-polyprenyl-3-methyl-5-hydroxy-6-metoxy-1,4-benzoquinol methylase
MSESVPCNYCEVDEATEVFGSGVAQPSRIVRCNRCGLMYASPRVKDPDHVQIVTWDANQDFVSRDPQRYEKEKLQTRDYARTRKLLNRLYPARGKLLEIGSGLGFLLSEFKKDGWEVLGVEPDGSYCRHAMEELGVGCISTILEEAGLPDESYDVIIMNHVIEHLGDPLSTLREINRVIKPKGHFVVETPRYDTLMFKLLGRRERSINCAGHIYFFTTRTLRNLYEAAGFQAVQLDYVGRSLTLDRLVWNVGVMSKNERVKEWLSALSRKLGLHKLRLYINLRDMQRACVQKVRSCPAQKFSVIPATSAAAGECLITKLML